MNSALESLSPDDKRKLDSFIKTALGELQEIEDRRGALSDTAKAVADELGVKPKQLLMAARSIFKNDLASRQADMDTMVDIINVTGHG